MSFGREVADDELSAFWFLVVILLPFFGLIAGIYKYIKKKKDAGIVLGASTIFSCFWIMFLIGI